MEKKNIDSPKITLNFLIWVGGVFMLLLFAFLAHFVWRVIWVAATSYTTGCAPTPQPICLQRTLVEILNISGTKKAAPFLGPHFQEVKSWWATVRKGNASIRSSRWNETSGNGDERKE
jgi:hypothetical protein